MRILNASQTRTALPMPLAIDAMLSAFGSDKETPLRIALGSSLFMPGRVGTTSGIKVVSTVPGNPVGIVVVFGEDGSPLGTVDGPTLTAIRTAAGSGLATDLLASPHAARLTILGAGAMAADQVAAVRAVRPITAVTVWSRSPERAHSFAAEIGGEAADDPDDAVAEADVITTVTPSHVPLFNADAISGIVHINAVGAFTPDMCEIPPDLVRRSFVVVDDRAAAAAEAGDLIQAGVAPAAAMGELLSGRAVAPDDRPTMFKSVGISSQDVAAAVAALENAEKLGIGTVV